MANRSGQRERHEDHLASASNWASQAATAFCFSSGSRAGSPKAFTKNSVISSPRANLARSQGEGSMQHEREGELKPGALQVKLERRMGRLIGATPERLPQLTAEDVRRVVEAQRRRSLPKR
jgi:hypothetical protein